MRLSSLFEFRLIRNIPKPSVSVIFCVLFFVLLRIALASHFQVSLHDLNGAVEEFVLQEQGEQPKHPAILVGGSSRNGMGIHMDVLEQRTGIPAGKVSCSAARPDFTFNALNHFEKECQNVKLVMIDVTPPVRTIDASSRAQGEIFIQEIRRKFWSQDAARKENPIKHYFVNLTERRPYVELYRKWKDLGKNEIYRFEDKWHQPAYRKGAERKQDELKKARETARKGKFCQNEEWADAEPPRKAYQELFDYIEDCHQRGIHIVFNATPRWYGTPCITQSDITLDSSDHFHKFLAEVDQRPNCTVIACGYFEEIDPHAQDEDYLFDSMHMTEDGAMLYTNWLVDRLLENSETAALFQKIPKTLPELSNPQPLYGSQAADE